MKLIDRIYESINNYPTLFWTGDYDTSRLLVLDHLFLVSGNGYAWTPDGYLVDVDMDNLAMDFEFAMPGGWYATKAPPYGERTYSNRKLPDRVHVANFAKRTPYGLDHPEVIPANIQPDYLDGLADVIAWAKEVYGTEFEDTYTNLYLQDGKAEEIPAYRNQMREKVIAYEAVIDGLIDGRLKIKESEPK